MPIYDLKKSFMDTSFTYSFLNKMAHSSADRICANHIKYILLLSYISGAREPPRHPVTSAPGTRSPNASPLPITRPAGPLGAHSSHRGGPRFAPLCFFASLLPWWLARATFSQKEPKYVACLVHDHRSSWPDPAEWP